MYGRKMRKLRDSRYAGLIFLAFVSNILINRQCCEINWQSRRTTYGQAEDGRAYKECED